MSSSVGPSPQSENFSFMYENPKTVAAVATTISAITAACLFTMSTVLIGSIVTSGVVLASAMLVYHLYQNQLQPQEKPELEPQRTVEKPKPPVPAPVVDKSHLPLKDQIDFAGLKKYGITRAHLDNYERQVKEKDFDPLRNLALVLDYKNIRDKAFIQWLFPMIEKMVKRKLFDDDQCEKLHKAFVDNRLYEQTQKQFTDAKGSINYLALLLSSPFFRSFTSIKDMKQRTLEGTPSILKQYIETHEIPRPKSALEAAEYLDAHNFFLVEQGSKICDLSGIYPKAYDEGHLNEFFTSYKNLKNLLTDAQSATIEKELISKYLKTQGMVQDFQLCDGCFALPLERMGLLENEGALFEFMKSKVNAVSLESGNTLEQLQTLMLTQPRVFENITSVVFTGTNLSTTQEFHREVAHQLRNTKAIYFRPAINHSSQSASVSLATTNFTESDLVGYKLYLVAPENSQLIITAATDEALNQLTLVNLHNIKLIDYRGSFPFATKYPGYTAHASQTYNDGTYNWRSKLITTFRRIARTG